VVLIDALIPVPLIDVLSMDVVIDVSQVVQLIVVLVAVQDVVDVQDVLDLVKGDVRVVREGVEVLVQDVEGVLDVVAVQDHVTVPVD
jgi:hypothetical protein